MWTYRTSSDCPAHNQYSETHNSSYTIDDGAVKFWLPESNILGGGGGGKVSLIVKSVNHNYFCVSQAIVYLSLTTFYRFITLLLMKEDRIEKDKTE